MANPLPDIDVLTIEGTVYKDIVPGKFSYAVWSDWDTWNDWVLAVNEPEKYRVTQEDIDNSTKFSSFILGIKCQANETNDGCCFVS